MAVSPGAGAFRRALQRALLCVALSMAAVAQAAPGWQVRLDTDPTLDLSHRRASERLVAQALAHLPPLWRAASGLDVQLHWRDDLPAEVHGRSTGARIDLRRDLLDPSQPASPEALTALLHELAHRFDRSAHGGLSRDPRLLDLAGWPGRPLRPGQRVSDNAMTDRSPDLYETASPAEFVAVNLEHFLLDPEYACRRPALHGYFADRFDWTPPGQACSDGLPFVHAPAPDADGDTALLELDPARVWTVDYLLAEANARPMSRWGHSMLRLVVCAPGRTPGPDCRFDLDHHLVLSFRAFVDDLQVSSLRGLTGGYPSRLFVLPMAQVIEEYTRVELRGLQSIPLRLSSGEIASLLERAAVLHWSYDGRYRFIDNNCAVETWSLLHAGVLRLAASRLRSITPTGLLRRLARGGIADMAVLEREDAVRAGYSLPSAGNEYQALLDVARAAQALPAARIDAWLDLSPDERAPWLATSGLRDGAALLVLEHAALRREELRLRDRLKRRLGDRSAATDTAPAADTLQAMIDASDGLSRPAMLLPATGYGLPQADERRALRHAATDRTRLLARLDAQLDSEGREALGPGEGARFDGTRRNIRALGERMRRLHHDAGGLRLD